MGWFSGSDMKNLQSSENYTVSEIGECLYIYVPKVAPQRVIISSHGGHAMVGGTNNFTVGEDTVLQFYSDDRYSVNDPGFTNFFTKLGAPKEVLSTGDTCYDYILTKYQGTHNKMKETYASIGAAIDHMAHLAQDYAKAAEQMTDAGQSKIAAQYASKAAYASKIPAVLTVRNRAFRSNMTLSAAIEGVQMAAPSVQIFDCLFCRSGWKNQSQDVAMVGIS
ncbi:MAG: putative adhesin [Pseudomonadota bacterium]